MSNVMFYRFLAIGGAFALAACSDSSSTVEPISATGFASATNTELASYDYTLRNPLRIKGRNGQLSLDSDGDIRLIGTNGTGPITVVIDGQTFVLERSVSNPGFASFEDGDNSVILASLINGQRDAVAVELFSFVDGLLNAGNVVIGLDTDPAVLRTMSGPALYQGAIEFTLRNGFLEAFGNGSFQFDVDFDASNLSGTAQLIDNDNPNSEFDFESVVVRLNETELQQNGFSGTADVILGDLGGTLVDSGYDGRFFGPEGETIGGTFFGQIDVDDNESDTLLEGVFLGPKADDLSGE